MAVKVGLIVVILLCSLAPGQKADELLYPDSSNEISAPVESTAPPVPLPANKSNSLPVVPATIVEAAMAEENLNVFVAGIRSAKLVELLNGPGPFTVFVPTDKAFAKISKTDLKDILNSNQTLASVLDYHIIEGNLSSTDFENDMRVTSKEGGRLAFNINSERLMVNNANITKADIIANNGIIHVIDTVLGYKALATQPQTPRDWLEKAIALREMGKYNESLKAVEKAIEKDPRLSEAWYEKGLILEILGRKKEAEAAFAKARI
jgi:uncharacterized surface protein with fasciclin (FAS1) repeats